MPTATLSMKTKDIFENKNRPRCRMWKQVFSHCFSARAGAKHVYAVDKSSIIDKARLIVDNNGLNDRITLIKSDVKTLCLPVKTR